MINPFADETEEFDALSAIIEDTGHDIIGLRLMERFTKLRTKLFPFTIPGVGGASFVISGGGGYGGGYGGPVPIFTGGVGISSMGSLMGGGGAGGSIGIVAGTSGAAGCSGSLGIGGHYDGTAINECGSYNPITSGIVTLPVAVNPGTEFVLKDVSLASVSAAVPNVYLTSNETWYFNDKT